MQKIAVTGATGQLGQLVISHLKMRIATAQIIALARDTAKAAGLDVEVRPFDYTQADNLAASLAGVDTLLLISSNEIGQRVAQHQNVIAAAQQAGVKRLVYTSLLHADRSILNLAPEHLATEQALQASGLNYTILRNGWYSENYTAAVPAALANRAFYGSAGQGKISSASRNDYAQAAAIVITSEDHDRQTYELAGDHAYTLSELAAEISQQTGEDIPYVDIPPADYAKALKQAGVPDLFAECLAQWDLDASQGALWSDNRTLSQLLGRPTTSLHDAVKAALAR